MQWVLMTAEAEILFKKNPDMILMSLTWLLAVSSDTFIIKAFF